MCAVNSWIIMEFVAIEQKTNKEYEPSNEINKVRCAEESEKSRCSGDGCKS